MPSTWGDWIRDQITQRDWSRPDAAAAFDVSEELLATWLAGDTPESITHFRQIADALELPVAAVMVHAGVLSEQDISLIAEGERRMSGTAQEAVSRGLVPPRFQINLRRKTGLQESSNIDEPDDAG